MDPSSMRSDAIGKTSFVRGAVLVMVLAAVAGCRPKHEFVWVDEHESMPVRLDAVPLRSGDTISITVSQLEQLRAAEPFVINADGTVVLPVVGPFVVADMTPGDAARRLDERLRDVVQNPDTRITVVSPRAPLVSVLGEVHNPDRYEMSHGDGVLQALARAGGLTEFARIDRIYVVRKYPGRARIRFRYADLVGAVGKNAEFELRDGDVIVVE
jgi:polysaccharide biosynthesis/export protein